MKNATSNSFYTSNFTALILVFISVSTLQSCHKKQEILKGKAARYHVSFKLNWNPQDFPSDYPNNAHFSRLIGWSHKANSTFFKVGSMASKGIIDMAESGKTSPLDAEINSKIANGEGFKLYIGKNLPTGSGTINLEVDVDTDNSSITLATMIAPSPDWYVAVVNVNLLESGEFVEQKKVRGQIYDAGSDSGESFSSNNQPTTPQEAIAVITTPPLVLNTAPQAAISEVTFTKMEIE